MCVSDGLQLVLSSLQLFRAGQATGFCQVVSPLPLCRQYQLWRDLEKTGVQPGGKSAFAAASDASTTPPPVFDGFSQDVAPETDRQYQMERDFDQTAVQPGGRSAFAAASSDCASGALLFVAVLPDA